MTALADEFITWVNAPERTVEEAFGAELLIEEGLSKWKAANKVEDPFRYDLEARREHRRERRLNPAHRHYWSREEIATAAEYIVKFTEYKHWTYNQDRTLTDLSAFRFCPEIKSLHLAPTEFENLEGLRFLPLLEDFWLQDRAIEDFSGLAYCQNLKGLHLWLTFPWCDMRSLSHLPRLEHLTLHGNIPMLRDVEPLPVINKVLLNGEGNHSAAIRNGHELPDMPLLREASIYPVAHLEGFEKFVSVQELAISGPYKSLAPLSAMSELRKLTLYGNSYLDLSPIAAMPSLNVLILGREYPVDYTPLLDSASLRELKPPFGQALSLEASGINAALGGWDDEFLAKEPRPLPEPVFRFIHYRADPPPGFAAPSGDRGESSSRAVKEAEGLWLADRLERILTRKFGRDWGETHYSYYSATCGNVSVKVHEIDIANELSGLVEFFRQELACLRNCWIIDLTIDPKSQWQKDPEAWKDTVQEELEENIGEARDRAERRREYLAYLDRLNLFKLREEQGEIAVPGEFAAPIPETEKVEDSDVLEPAKDGVEENWEAENHPSWYEYYMTVHVCEEGVWVPVNYYKTAHRLLLCSIEKYPGWSAEDRKHAGEEDN